MEDDKRSFGFATALLFAGVACELSSALLVLCNFALHALAAHALASISAALASYAIAREQAPKPSPRALWIAAACNGAFIASAPLLGMTVFVTVIAPAWRKERDTRGDEWLELPMHARAQVGAGSIALRPQLARPSAEARVRQALAEHAVVPIREVLEGDSSPAERIQAVMALRRMPARDALPLLRTALGDASEDVRLLAYAILERREKGLRASIERKLEALEAHEDGSASQLAALRELAHDHWELVHGGFVEGELAQRTLQLAAEHARGALELIRRGIGKPEGALSVLLARVELRRGETVGAAHALELAAQAGVADSTLAPLHAELAFIERRFDRIPGLLASVGGTQLDRPRLHPVIEHWRQPEVSRG
jgi:hypothetical protein